MDEIMKMYLNKIDNNVKELNNTNKIQVENVSKKIDELKTVIEHLRTKVEEIQIEYTDSKEAERIKLGLEKKIDKVNNELEKKFEKVEIYKNNEKKIYAICTAISITLMIIAKLLDKSIQI